MSRKKLNKADAEKDEWTQLTGGHSQVAAARFPDQRNLCRIPSKWPDILFHPFYGRDTILHVIKSRESASIAVSSVRGIRHGSIPMRFATVNAAPLRTGTSHTAVGMQAPIITLLRTSKEGDNLRGVIHVSSGPCGMQSLARHNTPALGAHQTLRKTPG